MQHTIDLSTLSRIIRDAWSSETSADPAGWTDASPAWGQCAVTALIVQDEFGGELLRVQATGENLDWGHYFNRLPSGVSVDFTQQQFPEGTNFSGLKVDDRERILDAERYPETVKRYRLLKRRVDDVIYMFLDE